MSVITNALRAGPVLQSNRQIATDTAILNRMAVLVGLVAFGLPVILWIGGNTPASCMRDSLSHFYYAPFLGGIFVGLLFFIGGFLIAYSGDTGLEDWGSNIAGLCAFGVALFPTANSGCGDVDFVSRVFVSVMTQNGEHHLDAITNGGLFQLFGAASEWHKKAAAIVFIYLGLFCIVVLKRIIPDQHYDAAGNIIATKARRNGYYTYCGITIFVCVAALGLKQKLSVAHLQWWDSHDLTFYFESLALWAFGLAWFIKGRLFNRLNDPK